MRRTRSAAGCIAILYGLSSAAHAAPEEVPNVPPQLRVTLETEGILPARTLLTLPETAESDARSFMLEAPIWVVPEDRMARLHECASDRDSWRQTAGRIAASCGQVDKGERWRRRGFYVTVGVVSLAAGFIAGALAVKK